MNASGFDPDTGEQIETFSFFKSAQTEEVVAWPTKAFNHFAGCRFTCDPLVPNEVDDQGN
jgi:hypothetical protein